jgi:hypothetical protein
LWHERLQALLPRVESVLQLLRVLLLLLQDAVGSGNGEWARAVRQGVLACLAELAPVGV